jgi:hypothetical protein
MNITSTNIENWIQTPDQLMSLSNTELAQLVTFTPIRDEYKVCERRHLSKKEEYQLSAHEKGVRHRQYKEALWEFKEKSSLLSLQLNGRRRSMTPELHLLRTTKEQLYASFKEELQRYKGLLDEAQHLYSIVDNIYSIYIRSMECFVLCLLRERIGRRFEVPCLRNEQYYFRRFIGRQPPASIVSYTTSRLSREELDTEMPVSCSICMEAHTMRHAVVTCCGHWYGKECLSTWHNRRLASGLCINCPLCNNNCLSLTKYEEIEDVGGEVISSNL